MTQMNDSMSQWGKLLGGAAAGAALMYMLDPERGSARRAQSGETLRGLTRQTGSALGNAVRSLSSTVGIGTAAARMGDRLDSAAANPSGMARQIESSVSGDGAAGRMASQAGSAIQDVTQAASEKMQGVSQSASELWYGAQQMMQGTTRYMRGDWAPGMRSMAMLGGGVLGLFGLRSRTALGLTLGMAGLALLTRGATNQPLKNVVSGKVLAQPVDLEKSIWIDASPEQVYDLWNNFDNFPRFMSHVVEVRDLGNRRSHWVVRGPAGSQFEWDAVTTEQSRPRRLAWRSEPGAEIAQSGSVQFEPEGGGTRVTVRMSYVPPAGLVGHGVAVLLGADPKRQMDDDLAHMKAFIERGAIPPDAARGKSSSRRSLH